MPVSTARRASRGGASGCGAGRPSTGSALALLVLLAVPVLRLDTGMPSIKVVPESDGSRVGYMQVQEAFGPGAPGTLQVVAPAPEAARVASVLEGDRGIVAATPAQRSGDRALVLAVLLRRIHPTRRSGDHRAAPRRATRRRTRRRRRRREPRSRGSAGGEALPVFLVVLGLGFLLLLVALQAPLIALVGVVTNLLATAAAFGVGVLIFQDGNLEALLGFESQGFLNAWGPVFFFAMIFAISMDYTVFLLSAAKEHWDRSHDPREAMVGGVAHSGRTIFAAAA